MKSIFGALIVSMALLTGCVTETYRVSYEDVNTGAAIPDSEAWPIKYGVCKDAYKASATVAPAPSSTSQPTIATSESEAAVELAAFTLQLLAEKSRNEKDEAEFLEACLLAKGIREVFTPI